MMSNTSAFQPISKKGFSFSIPYSYSGTLFAGPPHLVHCAEEGDTLTDNSRELHVCVPEGSTTETVVSGHLDGAAIRVVPDSDSLFTDFTTGLCNVIAGEPSLVYEQRAREEGYSAAEYALGSKYYSKEPLAMVSRGDDVEFSDFSNWILQALMAAEVMNITQETADDFPLNSIYGDKLRLAVAAVGNFGEMFERHFEGRFPRQGMNLINTGGGLLYSHPFGELDVENSEILTLGPVPNGTIETIESNSYVRCGVVGNRTGFATFNESAQDWSGLDVDFCRGLSAAMFSADVDHVKIVEFAEIGEGFSALNAEDIDVLAGVLYSMENDVHEPTTGVGYSLSPPYFFGGLAEGFTLATRDNDPQWSDFVRWVVWSTMHSEEAGITQDDAMELPAADVFGPKYIQMFRFVNLALGHYGDIYERNLGSIIPRSGPNLLNDGSSPQLNPHVPSFHFSDR